MPRFRIQDLNGLENAPTSAGSLRSKGQTAIGVLGDLGMSNVVDVARDIADTDTELGIDAFTEMFESPTLSVLGLIENSVGLILARLRTPEGRVPVDVIRRSIEDVKLTGLTSSEQVMNRLRFVQAHLERRTNAIKKRFGGAPDEPGEDPIADLPRYRIENGKLVPVN